MLKYLNNGYFTRYHEVLHLFFLVNLCYFLVYLRCTSPFTANSKRWGTSGEVPPNSCKRSLEQFMSILRKNILFWLHTSEFMLVSQKHNLMVKEWPLIYASIIISFQEEHTTILNKRGSLNSGFTWEEYKSLMFTSQVICQYANSYFEPSTIAILVIFWLINSIEHVSPEGCQRNYSN